MDVLTMKELLETGVHFGHRTRKWNPKMAPYIFTERKGIHIIDLEQTVEMFRKAYYTVRDAVGEGKEILFVGTKKQVQSTISDEARRCGAHFVNRRWLGGTLTNFGTIKQSIDRMKKLETMIEDGSIDQVPNKEASRLRRQLAKMHRNLDGLRFMERKPDLMFVIDPDVEVNAIREANIVGIPTIAIVDTNCNPDPIDYPIPGNDDAIKATKLITARIADAVLEGREGRQDEPFASPAAKAADEEAAEAVSAADAVPVAAAADEDAVGEDSEETFEATTRDAAAESEGAVEAEAEVLAEADAESADEVQEDVESVAEEDVESAAEEDVKSAVDEAAESGPEEDVEADEEDSEEQDDAQRP